MKPGSTAEHRRQEREASLGEDWRLFGPYLSERQWGTIREDYSEDGACWDYFPHDHARSRAYRFGEDGLLGFCDREARMCFGLALWNGRDPILKERLFGLSAPEGNHGEDVKELYYYLDSTPTHSYAKALYKYPLWAFPYERLVREGRTRGIDDPEFEIEDTGVFDHNRYVDVTMEYAKASPTDIALRVTLANRSADEALLHVAPQLWFRNVWSWGRRDDPAYGERPYLWLAARRCIAVAHETLGRYIFEAGVASSGTQPEFYFTENETNVERLFGAPSAGPFVKDAFHARIVEGREAATNPGNIGSKACAHYRLTLPPRDEVTIHLRLAAEADVQSRLGLRHVEETLRVRSLEADEYYASLIPESATADERSVLRQGYASLLWSKQFYFFNLAHWLDGDETQPAPPARRLTGRNSAWRHVDNRDVISVPDKWEYPWYAAWDLAFHMAPFAKIDPDFARSQLGLLLSERFADPSGRIPAYEFAFGDVNPPVHAWACLRVFEAGDRSDPEAIRALDSTFDGLMANLRWWRSLETRRGSGLFGGGFLGLDNASVFERGLPPPGGGHLEQADGTGWMAFAALFTLRVALELGAWDPGHEDAAIECFDLFEATTRAINDPANGLWDEEEGFYFDHVRRDGRRIPLKLRSVIGLVPLLATTAVDRAKIEKWPRLAQRVASFLASRGETGDEEVFLSVATTAQWRRVLGELNDEEAFLAPNGVRSLSKKHAREPFLFHADGVEYRATYAPDDSRTQAFGINSNWRGPVWLPINHLLIEALRSLDSGWRAGEGTLASSPGEIADDIESRIASLFLRGASGRRPCHGENTRYRDDPAWRDLVLFHEYFSGETGRGFGASHQTGWTALALQCIEASAQRRGRTS